MNPKVKLAFYVLLLGAMVVLWKNFSTTLRTPDAPLLTSTNAPAGTNLAATTLAPATNVLGVTNLAAAPIEDGTVRRKSARMGRLMGLGAGMFMTLVFLSLLIAQDVSRFLANRSADFIFNDNLEGVKDPQYEKAENVWAEGRHVEAIQLMREYLKRHPREQYVALRIAEIYETNLNNYLAAALEYEEVLKKRLPPERWGWAAVHLANLYSGKLNKSEAATKLLRRIVDEYGQTAAAKKARERLGLPAPVEAQPEVEPEPEPEATLPEPPPSNLPKGFRPK